MVGFVPEGSAGLLKLKLRLARRWVGTGWDRETARTVRSTLEPFARGNAAGEAAETTRVEPRFDAEITYAEITNDGLVRQPSFKALVPYRL